MARFKLSFPKKIANTLKRALTWLRLRFSRLFSWFKLKFSRLFAWGKGQVDSHPIRSFVALFALIFLAIVLSNFLNKPVAEEKEETIPKQVSVFSIGEAPKVTLQGQVEKSGVIPVIAQTGGIVQSVNAKEGQEVGRGAWLASLSSNYQGGSVPGLQRQIAQAQYDNISQTFGDQMSIIQSQRNLATASGQTPQDNQNIAEQAVSDAQSLVGLNDTILNSLNQTLLDLKTNNTNGSNDTMILSTEQIIAGVTAGQNQTKNGLRLAQSQTQTSQFQKETALKQLDIQEKALIMSKEISGLQLKLSQVAESMMFPSSPFNGVVQKLFVKEGQLISPGTTIAVISSTEGKTAKVTVFVPKDIATRVSRLEPSRLNVGGKSVSLAPLFVSTEAVSGNLYAVTYILPESMTQGLTDKEFISVEIPVGYAKSLASDPFIPIDAVYQSPESAYIYVVKNGKAVVKPISLGQIFGSFVEVTKGLGSGDKIILDRTVIAGDHVRI